MISLEYIWSLFAVTQAVIVTFQVGSKLLFHHQPELVTHSNSSNSTEHVVSLSYCDQELDSRILSIDEPRSTGFIGVNETASSVADSTDNASMDAVEQQHNDLSVAFHRAIQLGLQQQSLLSIETPSRNVDYEQIPYVVVKNRKERAIRNVEPYRMSLVPVLPNAQMVSENTTGINDIHALSEISNLTVNNNETQFMNHDVDTNDLDEYWETDYVVRNVSNTMDVVSLDAENIQIVARVRAYAPKTFQRLRTHFGIHDVAYRASLLNSGPYTFMGSNSKGSARTGGIFFYTSPNIHSTLHKRRRPDKKASNMLPTSFFVKSIKDDEFQTVRSHILPRYELYMKEYGRLSLLNRMYGLFEIELYNQTSTSSLNESASTNSGVLLDKMKNARKQLIRRYCLLVLNAVFDPSASNINEVFDLKGSVLGRQAKRSKSGTNEENDMQPQRVICKDLDLILEANEAQDEALAQLDTSATAVDVVHEEFLDPMSPSLRYKLYVGSEAKVQLFQQLQLDVDFLCSCSVMDYSLLVGVESCNTSVSDLSNKNQFSRNWWKAGKKKQNEPNISHVASPLSRMFGRRRGIPATYHFGIIDFLQPYNYKKELEYRWKGLLHKKNSYSCIPPDLYAQRLMNFLDQCFV